MEKLKQCFTDKKSLIVIAAAAAAILVAVVLWFSINHIRDTNNLVKGVDVSSYQGEIDWKRLAEQDVYFAFIKATEGKSFVDPKFEQNWKGARKARLKVGAYHFVNFEEDGKTQAEHFIQSVPKEADSLPPVIDLELYGDYLEKPMDKEKVQAIVNDMIVRFKEHYGKTPLIYTNYNTYNTYIADAFTEIPIWICDISDQSPELKGGHRWLFWQYSQREVLNGYTGDERFIDMDLYNGTLGDFERQFK